MSCVWGGHGSTSGDGRMIPYRADVAIKRLPWANWIIIGITVLVSLADFFKIPEEVSLKFVLWNGSISQEIEKAANEAKATVETEGSEGKSEASKALRALGKPLADDLADLTRFHPYQFVTYALFHAGLFHLFGNMLFLFVFGNAVNAKMGHAVYASFYVLFAIIAGIAWYLVPGGGFFALGASGAVMGVIGCFLVLYPLNEVSMFFMFFLTPFTFHIRAVWLILVYLVLDIMGFAGGSAGVANISHIVGMLAGAGAATALLLIAFIKPGRGEKTLLEILGLPVKRDEPFNPVSTTTRPVYVVAPPPQRAAARPGAPAGRTTGAAPQPEPDDTDKPIDLAPLDDS